MSCFLCFEKLDQTINLRNFEYKETMTGGIFYSYFYRMLLFYITHSTDPMPPVEILPSTFTEDMKKMQNDTSPGNSDIRLVFGSNSHPVEAHKIVLSIGSSVFRDFFLNNGEEVELSRLLSNAESCSCTSKETKQSGKKSNVKDTSNGNLQGLVPAHQSSERSPNLERKAKGKTKTCLHFNNSVSGKAFQYVLEFLYSGSLSIPTDADESLYTKITSLSHRLRIPWLGQICENITNGESYLNPSLVAIMQEERNKIVKENFVNRPHFSDVVFHVKNTVLYAHRALLMARSEVMAAMFGGSFCERDSHEVGPHHCNVVDSRLYSALRLRGLKQNK